MRGLPKFIQTQQDLDNLFQLCQEGKCGIDCGTLIEKIQGLKNQQYFNLPILEKDGVDVTVFYFAEATVGATLDNGTTIIAFEHIETTEEELEEIGEMNSEETSYIKTILTLSESLPDEARFAKIHNPCNSLADHGFNMGRVDFILSVLQDMHQAHIQNMEVSGHA